MHFRKGVSALASMVALGAIIVLVTGTTIWVENNRTTNYSSSVNSSNVIAAAESTLQDALLKLNLKTGVENYSLIVDGATVGVCYYVDSPSTGIYTIRAKAIKGNITRAMKALVNKDLNTLKFNIYSKEEELDSICIVTAATAPSAPLNPVWASSSSGQVTINWSAPTSNGGASITNYKVYKGTTSGGETLLTTLGNVLTITNTGLTDNTIYYYKISAVNSVGEGALSAEVSAIPGQTPTGGTVTVSNYAYGDYVGATYQISTNFTSSTTATSCDYSTNSGTSWTGATLSGTLPNYNCLKTGVTALDNIVYSITMRMTNSIGVNAATAITKTGDATSPTVTDNWTDSWTATSPVAIALTPSDSGAGISTTKYCTNTVDSCDPSVGTAGTSISLSCSTGSNCTQYARYASWDNVNNASAIYSKRVRQDKLVPTDGTLTVTPGAYQNSLSWTAASDTGSGLATVNTYKVVFLTTGSPNVTCSNGTQAYLGTATSYIHTGLTGGTTYYYRICAYDGVGNVSNGAINNGIPTTTTTISTTTTTTTPTTTTTTAPTCTCGSWSSCGSCSYGSTCATSSPGTQTRTCTPSGCASQSQSCTCTRSTDGTTCNTATACTYAGCAGSYNTYTCGGGTCNITQLACNRPSGYSCGSDVHSNCFPCSLSGCSGDTYCDLTTYSCDGSGSCDSHYTQSGYHTACYAANGTICDTTYSGWGLCNTSSCGGLTGTKYRTIYHWTCSSGSCVQSSSCTNCESLCCNAYE